MARGPSSTQVIAELVGSGRGAAARPAFDEGADVALSTAQRGDARVGDLVTVAMRGRQGRVVKVWGPSRSPRAAMSALLADEGLGWGFPRAVEEEAAAIIEGDPLADPGRRDLTAQDVVTIDPLGAKDHDDAIAAAVEGDMVRLWVHIADVSHYVAAGGAIDREALRRGCSVYVPGTVDPMLPARLSTDLCSLRPDVMRRALSVEVLVARDGEMHEPRFYRSAIRSERRLTYPEVDAHLAGAPLGGPGLEGTIAAAREAARRLRARRDRRGALEVTSGEPVFQLGDDRILGVHIEEQTESHRIVEDCMIAANEAVARHLIARHRPTLFRFHDDPEQSRITRMYDQLAELGVAMPALSEDALGPAERRDAARRAAEAVQRHIDAARTRGLSVRGGGLWALVLRSLAQAYYTPEHIGHSGLASAAYVHFTSPIRRYPDLLVHRGLIDVLGIGDAGPGRQELAEAGLANSESERDAAAVERRADRICGALLLAEQIRREGWDTVHTGEVTGFVPGGAFVAFGEAYDGFLPARRVSDEQLVLDPLEVALEGVHSGRGLRLGEAVEVRVVDIEPLRGRVSLARADAGAPRTVRGTRDRRRRGLRGAPR